MNRSTIFALSLPLAVVLAAGLAGCGGGDDVTCGEGTTQSGETCVAEETCDPGQVLIEGSCAVPSSLCDTGTIYVAGFCVRDDEFVACPPGETLVGDACVSTQCGEGLAFVDGACVPFDGVTCGSGTELVDGRCVSSGGCAIGEVFDGMECVPETACGMGTFEFDGECIPIDPTAQADVRETVEPNDAEYGEATQVTLPRVGSSLALAGTIEPATDLDGDEDTLEPDFDAYEFEGQAGQRISWEVTAVGVPSVAAYIEYVNEDASRVVTYERVGIPFGTRNARREMVLPLTGRYRLVVGDKSNFLRWSGTTDDDLDIWDGASDYTYLVNLTVLMARTPIGHSELPLDALGVASEAPQILLDLPADTLVDVRLEAEDPTAELRYFVNDASYSQFFGVHQNATHAVPSGGLLITGDYEFSTTSNTRYSLFADPVTATFVGSVDSTASINYNGVELGAGGARYYRIDVTTPIVLHTTVGASLESNANPLVQVRDEFLQVIGQSNGGGVVRSISIALDAGRYYVVPMDQNAPDTSGVFEVDINVTASELLTLESGVLSSATPSLTASNFELNNPGDAAFYQFDLSGVALAKFEARPDSNLDVLVEVFDGPVLATGGTYRPQWSSNSGGVGVGETVEQYLGDLRLWGRVRTVSALAPGNVTIQATIDEAAQLRPETEPNNDAASAVDLGLITPETPVRAHGDLANVNNSTADWYQFSLETPSLVRFGTNRISDRAAGTIVDIYNSELELVETDGPRESATGEVGLEPGTHYVVVRSPGNIADTSYLLTGTVQFQYSACVPTTDRCVTGAVNRCNAAGDSLTTIPCTLACAEDEGAYCEGVTEDETNDDPGTATDVGLLSDGRTVQDAFLEDRGAVRDVDWYRFRVDSLTNATLSTAPSLETGENLDTEIWLYSATDTTIPITSDNDGNGGGMSRIPNIFLEPGVYFARVEYNSTVEPPVPGGYRLIFDAYSTVCQPSENTCDGNTLARCNAFGTDYESILAECAIACAFYDSVAACDHVVEVETTEGTRNDSPPGQEVIPAVGLTAVEGTIDAGIAGIADADWYNFTLAERTSVSFRVGPSLLGTPTLDTSLTIYNSTDYTTPIASHNGSPDDVINGLVLPAGTYAIRVSEHLNTLNVTGGYRLSVDVAAPACMSGQATCGDATTLQYCNAGEVQAYTCSVPCAGVDGAAHCDIAASTMIPGTIGAADEVDGFLFTANAGSSGTFTVAPALADARIFICRSGDAGCTYETGYLARANQGTSGGADQISHTFAEDGVYEARVSFWFGATGDYTVTLAP